MTREKRERMAPYKAGPTDVASRLMRLERQAKTMNRLQSKRCLQLHGPDLPAKSAEESVGGLEGLAASEQLFVKVNRLPGR